MTTKRYVITRVCKSINPNPHPEWLATVPSYKAASDILHSVYGVTNRHRLPWGKTSDDGYLLDGCRYFITQI